MGVPGFYKWIISKLKINNFISTIDITKIDLSKDNIYELFIDANSIIHNTMHNINPDITDTKLIEKQIINQSIKFIDDLIDKLKPQHLTYISFDGVPPFSKIIQQRCRRYYASYQEKILSESAIKYNQKLLKWSNINITPGTPFMDKLHRRFKRHYDKYDNIIYSSCFELGEGEHKIMDYIRDNKVDDTKKRYIYGLDADILFLSMIHNVKNLYIFRENQKVENIYDVISIYKLKTSIISYCYRYNDKHKIVFNQNMIDDIIFICFLFGNDFIPHSPLLNIGNDMDKILQVYINNYKITSSYLTNRYNKINPINISFFNSFLKEFSLCEYKMYINKEYQQSMFNFNERNLKQLRNKEKSLIELQKNKDNKEIIDNLYYEIDKFKNEFIIYTDENNLDFPEVYEDYKCNYYINNTQSPRYSEELNNICVNYCDALLWVFNYYFNRDIKISYLWSYQYSFSPFLTDLSSFIEKQQYNINLFQEKNKEFIDVKNPEIKLNMNQQLFCVIPYTKLEEIHKELFDKLKDNDLYILYSPIEYKINTYNIIQKYKSIIMIPDIDINKVIELDI